MFLVFILYFDIITYFGIIACFGFLLYILVSSYKFCVHLIFRFSSHNFFSPYICFRPVFLAPVFKR